MSFYQLFDQFCLDFCLAWGFEEAITSHVVRLAGPCVVFSFAVVSCVFLWWKFFELLECLGSFLVNLVDCVSKKIVKKIKTR